jgi:beta-alanine degradation protein BauB
VSSWDSQAEYEQIASEASAAVRSGAAAVDLAEFFEHEFLHIFGHADLGVWNASYGRSFMHVITRPMIAVLLLAAGGTSTWAQDPVQVAPDNFKVLLENEQVRVLEFRDQPGDKLSEHSHPNYLVYFFNPGKRAFVLPDGKRAQVEYEAGEVRWLKPVTHSEENTGTQGARTLIIELKEQGG